MATQNLGGIAWTVSADTSPAVNSISDMDNVVDISTRSLNKMDKSARKASAGTKVLAKSAKETEKALAAKNRKIGQTSIQLQQLIGQVQGGVDPLTAFSQQIADIGIVAGFAFGGAIAGIAASITGIFLPSLFESKSAADELYSSMEALNGVVKQSEEGVNALSNEYALLAKTNAAAAQVQLTLAMVEANEALANSQEVIRETSSELNGWTTNIFDGAEALDKLRSSGKDVNGQLVELEKFAYANFGAFSDLNTAVERAQEQFGLTSVAAYELVSALIDANNNASPENFDKLDRVLSEITIDSGLANESLNEMVKELANGTSEGRKAAQALTFLRDALNGINTESVGNVNGVSNMVSALKEQAKASFESARATAIRRATEKGATAEQLASINASFDQIEANAKRSESTKQMVKDDNEMLKSMMKLRKERERDEKKASKFATGITDRGMSAAEKMAAEQDLLDDYYDRGLISEQEYQDALNQIVNEGITAREQMLQMSLGSFSSSFDEISNVLKKSEGEQSTAYKAMFALSKGFAIAQASLNLSLAVSNAMASGPFPWNLGAMAAVGAAGASLISSIGSAVYGGRENGGDMLGGKTYEVGEKNKPELLMIPGNGGKMFSNREAKAMMEGGSGGEASITINNYAAADGYQAKVSQNPVTHEQVIDIIHAQSANPNSRMRRNLSQGTNIQNTIGGGRN